MTNANLISQMTEVAKQAAQHAYCPYSHFPVGAAVLGDDGQIYAGCNVENAAYGSVICAEANAVSSAIAAGVTSIQAVLVYTPTVEITPCCGNCRQILNEFGPEMQVIIVSKAGVMKQFSLSALLPGAFGPYNLNA